LVKHARDGPVGSEQDVSIGPPTPDQEQRAGAATRGHPRRVRGPGDSRHGCRRGRRLPCRTGRAQTEHARAVRRSIRAVVPEAEEGISYGMPAFRVAGKVVAGFAAFKHHLAYLPTAATSLPNSPTILWDMRARQGPCTSRSTNRSRMTWSDAWSRRGWPSWGGNTPCLRPPPPTRRCMQALKSWSLMGMAARGMRHSGFFRLTHTIRARAVVRLRFRSGDPPRE
jgi:hypothetical protein